MFEQVAAAGAAYGYHALELRTIDGVVISSEILDRERARIRQVLREHGLGLIGLGASTRFAIPDVAERAGQGEELLRLLQLANELEAPIVRTFGGTPPVGTSDENAVHYVVAGLEPLLKQAEQLGVTIGLETHDAFSRGALVSQVLAALPHPRLGAIWDVLHPLRFGETIEETWQFIGPRVVHVHVKDGRPLEEPRTENPELRTENPEPRTQNSEPRTQNREHRAQSAEPRTQNREHRAQSAEPRTQNLELRTQSTTP
jgi:sugar phosphate isomerase/epimerase